MIKFHTKECLVKRQNLTITIFISICLLAAITLLITGSLWIHAVQERFKAESSQIRDIHILNMKTEIKNSVDSLVQFIEYRKQTTEDILKKDLHERVDNAYSIIQGIYEKNKGKLPPSEIKSQIIATLRDIRFNDGRGYYFIDTLKGEVILYPTIPNNEGKNLIDLQDDRGNYALREEIELVKKQGAGYLNGYWRKPGVSHSDFKKITYVRAFPPYNWYIGTGEYVDNVSSQIQNEIKAYVNQLNYGHFNQQYIFIHDTEGIELANGLFPEMIGQNNYDLEDLNGVKVFQEQLKISQSPQHGGFLTHYWPKPNNKGSMKKLTYVTSIPDWNWVVGSGIDMQFLENLVANKKLELQHYVRAEITKIILLLAFIFIISLLMAKLAVSSINKNITLFVKNMEKSSHNLSMIDVETVEYNDFKNLAVVSNQMTHRINTLLYKDELTGLFNRRYINKAFSSLVSQAMESKQNISLIMFDIDLFKEVNDQYGHQTGDVVLIKIAEIIQGTVRDNDYVGRYGGEEIVVILPNTENATTFEIAQRIRKKIEAHNFAQVDKIITISGGIVTSHKITADEMIKQADDKLYQAKNNGRNQIVG